MFSIVNTLSGDVGPFGLTAQQTIVASGSYAVDDTSFDDFFLDQKFIASVQDGSVNITIGLVTYSRQEAVGYLMAAKSQLIKFSNRTNDGRDLMTTNRVPAGFSLYNTSKTDDIPNGKAGASTRLLLTQATPQIDFQRIEHFYAVGGRSVWESGGLDDALSAFLVAPATTGLVSNPGAGAFNLVAVGPSSNLIVPAVNGNYDLDLTAKLNANVPILMCTPVPVPGNNGFFDYDSDTNVLTVNSSQKGGYNLYDFEIIMFCFVNAAFGRPTGSETVLESSDVVGKLIYNTWKMRFVLSTQNASTRVGVTISTAGKKTV